MKVTTRMRRWAHRSATTGACALVAVLAAAPIAHAELQPMTVRIASDLTGPPHPAGITMEYIREKLPEVIPGSKVQTYYAGSLYRIPEAVEAMTDGNLEELKNLRKKPAASAPVEESSPITLPDDLGEEPGDPKSTEV